jgi:hypothetical protein
VAFALAASAPAQAARLVEDGMSPGWLQAEAAASVAHRWSGQDAAAAARWVEALPEGPLRDRAREELADRPTTSSLLKAR